MKKMYFNLQSPKIYICIFLQFISVNVAYFSLIACTTMTHYHKQTLATYCM